MPTTTTIPPEATEVHPKTLAWDSYLAKRFGDGTEDMNARLIRQFRETTWGGIERDLKVRFGIIVDTEPHWVGPGTAVYWQEDVTMKPVPAKRQDGSIARQRLVESSRKWVRTGPLPAQDADSIAHYLGKGYRLRPPGSVEAKTISDPQAPPPAARKFPCARHGRPMAFTTWGAYLDHCSTYKEDPIGFPDGILEKAKGYPYYCPIHDQGFTLERQAKFHARYYGKKWKHPTAKEMEVRA